MIHEPQVRRLANVATELKHKYPDTDNPWISSPFAWIKTQASRTRGKIGEELVQKWCGEHGLRVEGVRDTQADMKVQGHRVEVKSSTLWKSGIYKFQQIRDQDYAFLICMGLSPTNAHCWIIPKDVLFAKDVFLIHVKPQHKGKEGKDTYWFQVKDPDKPEEWLDPYGGTLADASRVLVDQLTG